ncbi:MAG: biotin--[acetyl-CoA-carboxylase] ligase [Candidatus Eisenbacteria bacterium]
MGFDQRSFLSLLPTRRLGRTVLVRKVTSSTNDDAWDALGAGLGDGVVVVADRQEAGRGRNGRLWEHAEGCGLAMSIALHLGCDVRQAGLIPLGVGLALAQAAARLGIESRLKWPNDVLVSGRKLAGVLCEVRRIPQGGDAVVIGVGVNVGHTLENFSPELRVIATSFRLEGVETTPEAVAAAFLGAFEPLWPELQEGDRSAVLDAWSARAAFWGEPVTVRTPSGPVTGVAQRLDRDGGLVLRLEGGTERLVLAGDLELSPQMPEAR